MSPIILIKFSDAPRRRNKGTVKQLEEIAALVLFKEWSDAPRRRRINSDLIFSFYCIKTKGQRKEIPIFSAGAEDYSVIKKQLLFQLEIKKKKHVTKNEKLTLKKICVVNSFLGVFPRKTNT